MMFIQRGSLFYFKNVAHFCQKLSHAFTRVGQRISCTNPQLFNHDAVCFRRFKATHGQNFLPTPSRPTRIFTRQRLFIWLLSGQARVLPCASRCLVKKRGQSDQCVFFSTAGQIGHLLRTKAYWEHAVRPRV